MSDQDRDAAPQAGRAGAGAPRRRSALDGPGARIAAFGVFLLCAAALAWIHRDDLFPPEAAEAAGDDPVARCLAGRLADIDLMRADGVIDEAQAARFAGRAEALCRAQAGGAGSGAQ